MEGAAVSRLAGGRLPASYVNYLLVNGGIVMPSFGVPEDSAAAELLGRLYPHRRLVQVPSLFFLSFMPFFCLFWLFLRTARWRKLLAQLFPHRRLVQLPYFFGGQRGSCLAVSILADWCTAFVYYNRDDNLCIDSTVYIYR